MLSTSLLLSWWWGNWASKKHPKLERHTGCARAPRYTWLGLSLSPCQQQKHLMWMAKEREHSWVQVLSPLLTVWPWTSRWSVLLILTTPTPSVLFPFCRDLLRNVKSGSTVCWGWNPGRSGFKTHGISILAPSPWITLFQVISAEFSSILTLGPPFLRIQFLSLMFGSRAPWREKNGNVPSYSRRNR